MNANRRLFLLSVVMLVMWVASIPAVGCFSIVVGRKASVDGYVILAHNEDDGAPQIVNHYKVPRKQHRPAEQVMLRNGGKLEQAEWTWECLWSEMPGMLFSDSYVNEWGVAVTSDNCPSREDRPEITDGGIGFMLRKLIAQQARTAREGVLLAAELVERFGYIDSGRTYVICDPMEGWLFCVVNGKHWIAQRVPDNEVVMVANTYTIGQVDLRDRKNVLACTDIVDYAVERGWYDPEEGPFDFAAVYANPDAAASPSNVGRKWAALQYVTDENLQAGPGLPFSIRPNRKLGAGDIMEILRHDNTAEGDASSSGASASGPGQPLCSPVTQTAFVMQLRKDRPIDLGVVHWVCLGCPRTSFFVPFHFGIEEFPRGWALQSERPAEGVFDAKVKTPFVVDSMEAFWTFSNFRDKVDSGDTSLLSASKNAVRDFQRDALALQGPVEKAAKELYKKDRTAGVKLLENHSKGLYMTSLEMMAQLVEPIQ